MGDLALPESNQVLSKPLKFTRLHLKTKFSTMALSKVKQNFHSESESLLNKQINMELYASYTYMSMAAYFAREDVALHGFAKRFRESSAEKLIEYQTMRGGRVVFKEISKPSLQEWGTALE